MSFLLKLVDYNLQKKSWPSRGRHILLQHDRTSVIVYTIAMRGNSLRSFYKGDGSEIKYHHPIDGDNKTEEEDEDDTSASKARNTAMVPNSAPSDSLVVAPIREQLRKSANLNKTEEDQRTLNSTGKHRTIINVNYNNETIQHSKSEIQEPTTADFVNHNAEKINNHDTSFTGADDFVWLETNFVRMINTCKRSKKSSIHNPIIAIMMLKAGLEEILTTCSYDTEQIAERGEIIIEWCSDMSLTGDALERLTPIIGIRGNVLQRFYEEWVQGIKDITDYVDRQRNIIANDRLNDIRTPEETVYMPESTEVNRILGLDENDDTHGNSEEDKKEIKTNEHFEPFTLAELFTPSIPDVDKMASSNSAREAILFLYGTFNPVHRGHVDAIIQGKQWLEDVGKYKVLDTRIAIACDNNVKEKFANSNELCIGFEHRLKLCELACIDHPWITVSKTPAESQPKSGESLRNEMKKPNATLVVLMGSDRAVLPKRRTKMTRRDNKFILCIGRKGMSRGCRHFFEEAKQNDPSHPLDFYVVPTEMTDISSTAIRKKLQLMKDRNMGNSFELKVLREMVEDKWITEQIGEYIFQNWSSILEKKCMK